MKNYNSKKYIAFTLAEMTIVLLIMSIIAAVSAPIITKNIKNSDSTYKISPAGNWEDMAENGGIYYNTDNTDFVSVGVYADGTPESYGYPTLILNSQSTYGIGAFSQLSFKNIQNNITQVISADAYHNLLIGYGNLRYNLKDSTRRNTLIGQNAIIIGSKNLPYANEGTLNDAIVIGSYITSGSSYDKTHNKTITIGYAAEVLRDYSISIGTQASFNSATLGNNHRDMINIGHYAGADTYYSKGGINIGNHAGKRAFTEYATYIGTYAGAMANKNIDATDEKGYLTRRNIAIGTYAAYNAFLKDDNIMIGPYVAKQGLYSSLYDNAIIIGAYAGTKSSIWSNKNNSEISIGYYAGTTGGSIDYGKTIAIGYYAMYGANTRSSSAIGAFAGSAFLLHGSQINGSRYYSSAPPLITLGFYASANTPSNFEKDVAIGAYAGYAASPNFAIGYQAGTGAKGGFYIGLGAGNNNLSTSNYARDKLVIASGHKYKTLALYAGSPLSQIYGPNVAGSVVLLGPYMGVVGETKNYYTDSAIVLYANKVASLNTNMVQYKFSDERLKENIVPSNYSIKDLRKLNVYNYSLKMDNSHETRIGLIAQEVKKVFPQAVSLIPKVNRYAVSGDWILYSMINAVKDVDKALTSLQNKFNKYVKDFLGLKSKVAKLEAQALQLKQQNAMLRTRLNNLK